MKKVSISTVYSLMQYVMYVTGKSMNAEQLLSRILSILSSIIYRFFSLPWQYLPSQHLSGIIYLLPLVQDSPWVARSLAVQEVASVVVWEAASVVA